MEVVAEEEVPEAMVVNLEAGVAGVDPQAEMVEEMVVAVDSVVPVEEDYVEEPEGLEEEMKAARELLEVVAALKVVADVVLCLAGMVAHPEKDEMEAAVVVLSLVDTEDQVDEVADPVEEISSNGQVHQLAVRAMS